METVPIVFASDNKYLPYTYVTIYTILQARKYEYYIQFYILVDGNTTHIKYDKEWVFDNYSITYIEVKEDYFDDIPMRIQHITKPTYYRLLLPLYLKECDKCIYLDGDIIVNIDIYYLFNYELDDNYLGVVRKANLNEIPLEKMVNSLNIPNGFDYFNAGVLLMNLKRMRETSIVDIFLQHIHKNYVCQDQDILNICCYKHKKMLPGYYNVYSVVYGMKEEHLRKFYSDTELDDILSRKAIIHFATENTKPWNNKKTFLAKEWWDIAQQALPEEVVHLISRKRENAGSQKKNSFEELIHLYEKHKKCIIFGYTELGKVLYAALKTVNQEKDISFWDNDEMKTGHIYNDAMVNIPEKKCEDMEDILIIVVSQRYVKEMMQQLWELEYNEESVIRYKKKSITYYESFDEESYEVEKNTLEAKLLYKEIIQKIDAYRK